jgi:hypothetical protein
MRRHAGRMREGFRHVTRLVKVMADIRGQNEIRNKQKLARYEELQRVKDDMIARGVNPYVVFKQEDLDR